MDQLAPMSTAHDETDTGPEEHASVFDQDEVAQLGTQDDSNLPTTTIEALRGVCSEGHDEADLLANGKIFGSDSNSSAQEDETASQTDKLVADSALRERLSSADGSPSIPDDSPSVQVRLHCVPTTVQLLTRPEFIVVHPWRIFSLFRTRAQSNPISPSV